MKIPVKYEPSSYNIFVRVIEHIEVDYYLVDPYLEDGGGDEY